MQGLIKDLRCDYRLLALEAAEKDKPNHGVADLVGIDCIFRSLSDRSFRRHCAGDGRSEWLLHAAAADSYADSYALANTVSTPAH
jgi:hypothetical protein